MQTDKSGPLGPEDASDPESRWWWRLGHAGPWLVSASWVIVTIAMLANWELIGFSVSVLMFVAVMTSFRHDFQPVCIRCLREQPDKGGEEAKRRLFHLWAYHLPSIGPLGKLLATFGITGLWIWGNAINDSILGKALILASGLLIAYEWYLSYQHRRLKPWCPWCKDPGEDDPVVERDPDPSMTKQG